MRSFTTIRDSFHGQLNKECNLKKLVTLSNVTLPYSKTGNCSEILKLCALCNYSKLNVTYVRSMFSRVSIPNTLPIEKTSTNTSFKLSRLFTSGNDGSNSSELYYYPSKPISCFLLPPKNGRICSCVYLLFLSESVCSWNDQPK